MSPLARTKLPKTRHISMRRQSAMGPDGSRFDNRVDVWENRLLALAFLHLWNPSLL